MEELKKEIKKTLEKQLELLSKRAENCDDDYLTDITNSMIMVAKFLTETNLD